MFGPFRLALQAGDHRVGDWGNTGIHWGKKLGGKQAAGPEATQLFTEPKRKTRGKISRSAEHRENVSTKPVSFLLLFQGTGARSGSVG